MGYYTRYDISNNSEEIQEAILNQSQYSDFDSEVKWYDYREDMKKVSLKFPGVLLEVSGEGEENGDIWRAFYKDGRECYQKAQIVFPEFYTPADWN